MKNVLGILVGFVMILLIACDGKQVKFYPTVEGEAIINVDGTGSFNESETVLRSEIEGEMNDLDIPEDGEIEEVDVESITVTVTKLEGNEANEINLNGSVIAMVGGLPIPFVQNYTMPLTQNVTTLDLATLIPTGIEEIVAQLGAIIMETQQLPAGFTGIQLHLDGTTVPTGQSVKLEIKVNITAGVVYSQEIDVI